MRILYLLLLTVPTLYAANDITVVDSVPIISTESELQASTESISQTSTESMSPTSAESTSQTSTIKLAPNFTLMDTSGEEINLHDFTGKHIVLEWFNPDCRRVQQHYQNKSIQKLLKKYRGKEVIWLAINSSYYMNQEDNKRWQDVNLLSYRLLGDFTGEVGKLYQAKTTPQVYVINPTGMLIYQGAFDDNPEGDNEESINYVELTLDESLAGKEISNSKTEPYGCLVKYKY